MKKLFQIIGFISLMGISFFYTEKTTSVVKEYDQIMISIKDIYSSDKVDYKNAIIKGNTIIPGISGKTININKSYNKMKRYGKFEKSLLVYDILKPKISVKNKDKFIIKGNPSKMNVSLIFLIKDNDQIDNIMRILTYKKVKGNFYFENDWFLNRTDKIINTIKQKHIVGMIEYSDWNVSVIDKIGKQKNIFCYSNSEDLKLLKKCKNNNFYTIKVKKNYDSNYYHSIKNDLQAGSIISVEVNQLLEEELPIIINYIKSKGYNIISLEELIKE